MTAPEEYLEREVLKLSSGIGHLGAVQLGPAIAVLCTWLVVCATLSKGIKSSGKVRNPKQSAHRAPSLLVPLNDS